MKKGLKLVLVVPNYHWSEGDEHTYWTYLPYGLCCLAAMVEDLCSVEIIDAYESNMTSEEFSQALKKADPDVVGITVIMDQFASSGHRAAGIAKSVKPEAIVMMGGVYSTMNPETAIKDINVDYVVIGEGEYVFKDMIGYFLHQNPLPGKGICYRSNEKVVNTGRAEFIKDLDALPRPAYHLIPFERYSNTVPRRAAIGCPSVLPNIRMITSRGCPYGCIFCQVEHIVGKKFRAKSPEMVLDEIAWLKDKYNVRSMIFEEDNFLLDKNRVRKILNGIIDRNLVMPWILADAAVFRLDEDLLKLIRASGCEHISLAIETGSDRILKEVIHGKPIDFEHAKKMVRIAKDLGIYVAANFIIGFPSETWDEIRQTIRFAEDLDTDYVRFFAAIPLRNTKLWDLCVREGVFKKGYDHFNLHSCWSTGLIETKNFTADDLTLLRAYEWDRINFTSAEKRQKTAKAMSLTEEELLHMRRKTMKEAVGKVGLGNH